MSKSSYIVSFHRNPKEKLVKRMKDMWKCGKVYENIYVINEEDSPNMCEVIRDMVSKTLDSGNYVFVAKMTGQAAWSGAYDNDWLKKHIIECGPMGYPILHTTTGDFTKAPAAEVVVPKITVKDTDLDSIMNKVTSDLDNLLNSI